MPGGGSSTTYDAQKWINGELYLLQGGPDLAGVWHRKYVKAPDTMQPGYQSSTQKLQEQLIQAQMDQIKAQTQQQSSTSIHDNVPGWGNQSGGTSGGGAIYDIATQGGTGAGTDIQNPGATYTPATTTAAPATATTPSSSFTTTAAPAATTPRQSEQITRAIMPLLQGMVNRSGDPNEAYYQDKFSQLARKGSIGKPYEGMPLNTIADLKGIFESKGLTPATHYEQWGKGEGLANPTSAANPFVASGGFDTANPYEVGAATTYDALTGQIAKEQEALGGQTQNYLDAFKQATQWTPESRGQYMNAMYGVYSDAANKARATGQEGLSERGISGGGQYDELSQGIERGRMEDVARTLGQTYAPSGVAPSYEPYANLASAYSRDPYSETILPVLQAQGQLSIFEAMNPSLFAPAATSNAAAPGSAPAPGAMATPTFNPSTTPSPATLERQAIEEARRSGRATPVGPSLFGGQAATPSTAATPSGTGTSPPIDQGRLSADGTTILGGRLGGRTKTGGYRTGGYK